VTAVCALCALGGGGGRQAARTLKRRAGGGSLKPGSVRAAGGETPPRLCSPWAPPLVRARPSPTTTSTAATHRFMWGVFALADPPIGTPAHWRACNVRLHTCLHANFPPRPETHARPGWHANGCNCRSWPSGAPPYTAFGGCVWCGAAPPLSEWLTAHCGPMRGPTRPRSVEAAGCRSEWRTLQAWQVGGGGRHGIAAHPQRDTAVL